MTKKDYIKFAQMLKYYNQLPDQTPEEAALLKEITGDMIIIFEKDNPLFSASKFRRATLN